MKRINFILSFIFLFNTTFSHDHIFYTNKLDVSEEKEIRMKAILAHPESGKKVKPASIATNDEGKTSLPLVFFVMHNGIKKNLLSNVNLQEVKYNNQDEKVITYDATYAMEDGLKGKGTWIFILKANTKAHGWNLTSTMKIIASKEYTGYDYSKRIAENELEILPLNNPVKAWKESVFRAKFVDKNGNPIKNAKVDIMYMNVNFDIENNLWNGGEEIKKAKMTTFTDDNGIFAFTPSREGHWFVKATSFFDKKNKIVEDASLLIEFE